MLSFIFLAVALGVFYLAYYRASNLELKACLDFLPVSANEENIQECRKDLQCARLHSRPVYHAIYTLVWSTLIPLFFTAIVAIILNYVRDGAALQILEGIDSSSSSSAILQLVEIKNVVAGSLSKENLSPELLEAVNVFQSFSERNIGILYGFAFAFIALGFFYSYRNIELTFAARTACEKLLKLFLMLCSLIAIFTTVGIICSLLFESIRFFNIVPVHEFLFGLHWSPQIAIRPDQVGSTGSFGAVPIFTGTLLIAAIAMCIAGPCGLFSAIYLSEYASPLVRKIMKPVLEVLAGIPTVVYGFFAALTVAPIVKSIGAAIGLSVSSESALAAGMVMGVMIIPFISSLSDDVINAVPQTLRDGSYALGATRSETIKRVILPAALPGIVGSFMLAISRAIGETMIVVMAAGLAANLTLNPFSNVTTVTVQIVTALVGDQEFDSAKTLSVFALGLVLFCITLLLNVISMQMVKRYREQYD